MLLHVIHGTYYFNLKEENNGGSAKCFKVEVPIGQRVFIQYDYLDFEPTLLPHPVIFLKSTLAIASNDVVADSRSGGFRYISTTDGEHEACVRLSSLTGRVVRFMMNIDVGEEAIDYAEVVADEHLSTLEVGVRKINDHVNDIRKEQDYQHKREQQFRQTQESTASRVMWWSLLQTVILIAVGAWQVVKLRAVFKKQKLI
jgi:hypothetical protein